MPAQKKAKSGDLAKRTLQGAASKARGELDEINQRFAKLKRQLENERATMPLDHSALQAALEKAQTTVERIKSEISRLKATVNKRKKEIDEWKLWYNSLPGIDKNQELQQLLNEISWRAEEINSLNMKIGAFYAEHTAAEAEFELAKQRLDALSAGAYDQPIEADPRLLAIETARKSIRPTLDKNNEQ